MSKFKKIYWPAIFWSAIIFTLLIIPGSDLPEETNFLEIPYFDKWVHFGIFAFFVILWSWATRYVHTKGKLERKFIWIALLGVVFGYAMELVQKYFVPNRDYDLLDVAADAAGCLAGLIFSWLFLKKNRPL